MLSTSPQLANKALEAAPDAIIIIDASGAIRYTNRQISALFGYPHDEIMGLARWERGASAADRKDQRSPGGGRSSRALLTA